MKPFAVILTVTLMMGLGLCGLNVAAGSVIEQEETVTVNLGINYGTGSVEWHNGTAVPSGESLLNATMRVATVEYTTFSGMGAFVTGINDVRQNPAANLYWNFWVYNAETRQYEYAQVGAAAYELTSDQTIQWYYENAGSLQNPALRPNTSVSVSARSDSSTSPPAVVITGSIYPSPGGPVNVTLEYSGDQGASYQEMARITSASDGTFSYSWQTPTSGTYMIRADAQGVKSQPFTVGVSAGIPGFPLESLLMGSAVGVLVGILSRKRRRAPSC